jgi:hypothetical protein
MATELGVAFVGRKRRRDALCPRRLNRNPLDAGNVGKREGGEHLVGYRSVILLLGLLDRLLELLEALVAERLASLGLALFYLVLKRVGELGGRLGNDAEHGRVEEPPVRDDLGGCCRRGRCTHCFNKAIHWSWVHAANLV